ncbi:hypothetical protein GE107_14130 [Cohnella sp. CFH 77786]|nr:hypothetical protein [Cohnella sp. CFH 77786]
MTQILNVGLQKDRKSYAPEGNADRVKLGLNEIRAELLKQIQTCLNVGEGGSEKQVKNARFQLKIVPVGPPSSYAKLVELGGKATGVQTIRFDRPADRWEEALPVGNGFLGGMLFGGVDRERRYCRVRCAGIRTVLEDGQPAVAERPEPDVLGFAVRAGRTYRVN